MWNEVDPRVSYCIQNALSSFRHEILVENFDGIPVLQQHGSADDNVPIFHSRRLHMLISQKNSTKSNHLYELEGRGHWYKGVMTTPHLKQFFEDILEEPRQRPLPLNFAIIVCNPAEMGPRGGLQVDHLAKPGQAGKIDVSRDISLPIWRLCTSNVRSFHFVRGPFFQNLPSILFIDGREIETLSAEQLLSQYFHLNQHGEWNVSQVPRHFAMPILICTET